MRTLTPPLFDLVRFAALQQNFENALQSVLTLIGSPADRTGIYVDYGRQDGLVLASTVVGEPKVEKAEKYYICAGNKIRAIGAAGGSVLTSDEVQNPGSLIYGGGHRDESGSIWAASGLAEPWQDACVTLLALRWANFISRDWSLVIADRTGNPLWEQVRGTFIPEG